MFCILQAGFLAHCLEIVPESVLSSALARREEWIRIASLLRRSVDVPVVFRCRLSSFAWYIGKTANLMPHQIWMSSLSQVTS